MTFTLTQVVCLLVGVAIGSIAAVVYNELKRR